MTFPKKYGPAEIPPSVQFLLSVLLPQLIEGEHPALEVLREQYRVATITDVELTGVGCFVHFEVPLDSLLTDPANLTGGSADIKLTGARHGAGCVLFVRDGRLAMFEGFTYDDTWSEDAQVVAVGSVAPISPEREIQVQEARRRAANIAAEVLASHVSAVVGAIDVNRLRSSADVPDDDPDFRVFMLIDSECDGLPFGSVRQYWSDEALSRKQPDVERAERWAMDIGREAFENVVRRFGPAA